jgi:DNA-binding MarR family transcriptional regulator
LRTVERAALPKLRSGVRACSDLGPRTSDRAPAVEAVRVVVSRVWNFGVDSGVSDRVISNFVITEMDMARDLEAEVEAMLPLPPAFLHILIALGDGERHGYSIMQNVSERTEGRIRMSPGTLYGSIKRMLSDGLIEELTSGAAGADERRRFYRTTKFGRRVAAAEADRLASLLSQARSSGLVPRRS